MDHHYSFAWHLVDREWTPLTCTFRIPRASTVCLVGSSAIPGEFDTARINMWSFPARERLVIQVKVITLSFYHQGPGWLPEESRLTQTGISNAMPPSHSLTFGGGSTLDRNKKWCLSFSRVAETECGSGVVQNSLFGRREV